MKNEKMKTSRIHFRETNSIWRKVLHLAVAQKTPKSFSWSADVHTDTFSFLDKGSIRLECTSFSGNQRIIFQIESGCIFREVGMVAQGNPAGAIVTLEDCVIYNFPMSLLQNFDFIRQHPELISNLLETLAEKTFSFFSILVDASENSPTTIVARYIERLAQRYASNIFSPQISQIEFALNIGLHRSTVSKVMKYLRDEKIMGAFTRNKLEILDRERLQKIAFDML